MNNGVCSSCNPTIKDLCFDLNCKAKSESIICGAMAHLAGPEHGRKERLLSTGSPDNISRDYKQVLIEAQELEGITPEDVENIEDPRIRFIAAGLMVNMSPYDIAETASDIPTTAQGIYYILKHRPK
jgi:hypothetical protein